MGDPRVAEPHGASAGVKSSRDSALQGNRDDAILPTDGTPGRHAMTQTTNRLFDEMARLMNDAAGVAQGVRREFDTLFRSQAERMLRELDVVTREEFEAVKDMVRLAREENDALKARIAALEIQVGASKAGTAPADPPGVSESSP